MKKVKKILIVLITLLLLAACGTSNTEEVEVADSTVKEVSEVVSSRSIVIADITGDVTVTHSSNESLKAYEGMSLLDGDDVVVGNDSNLTLNIDSDKHLFAEANTHFWLTATGKEGNTKTVIHLDAGSVLCDIKEKLKDDETFDIQTATSTMCVRGTVFRVCLFEGKDKSKFDLVEVYDGKVWSNIDNTEDNVTLEPGQCALIRKTEANEEKPVYVLEEDIDDNFVKETGLNLSLENVENGESGALKLSLENVSVDSLQRLLTIIDEGIDLVVDKEEIEKVEETKKEEVVEKETVKVVHEHTFVTQSSTASTCTTQGTITYVCSGCGETRVTYLPLADHTPTIDYGHGPTCTEAGETDGQICSVCGTVLKAKEYIGPTGHHDVLDADGITHKCSVCGVTLYVDTPVTTVGYEINSFGASSFSEPSYASTYDSSKSQLVYDFTIPGVTLSSIMSDGSSSTSITNADIHAKYYIPLSELTNREPDMALNFYYEDEEITINNTSKESFDGSITKTMLNYVARDFSNFKVQTVPDFENNGDSYNTVTLLNPPDGSYDYLVCVNLSANADFTDSNGTTHSDIPVNLNFEIKLASSSIQDTNTWNIREYCFNSQKTSSTINLFFSDEECYNSFINKVISFTNIK